MPLPSPEQFLNLDESLTMVAVDSNGQLWGSESSMAFSGPSGKWVGECRPLGMDVSQRTENPRATLRIRPGHEEAYRKGQEKFDKTLHRGPSLYNQLDGGLAQGPAGTDIFSSPGRGF